MLHDDRVELRDNEGRTICFSRPALSQRSKQLAEGLDLDYGGPEHMILRQPGQPDQAFTHLGDNHFRLSQLRPTAYRPPRGHWRDEQGYAINLHYNRQGRLARVNANWGRGLLFDRDEHGRINTIHQLDADNRELTGT